MKKGNSGSGAAAAGAENAVAPIAIAPKAAAARRVFSLNELNIGRPLQFAPCRASSSASLRQSSTGQPFQDICTMPPKWFRRVRELFQDGFVAGFGDGSRGHSSCAKH